MVLVLAWKRRLRSVQDYFVGYLFKVLFPVEPSVEFQNKGPDRDDDQDIAKKYPDRRAHAAISAKAEGSKGFVRSAREKR